MKWAEVFKGAGWHMLVGFRDKEARADQRVRFGYEYPQGEWRDLGYYEARAAGYDKRRLDEWPLQVEMCHGEVCPAVLEGRAYRGLKAERMLREMRDLKGYETGMTAEDIAVRWPE